MSTMWHRGAAIPLLEQLPNLRRLCLSGCSIMLIPEHHMYIIQSVPKLQSLNLDVCSDSHSGHQPWRESTLEPLQHLRFLTSLSLNISDLKGPMLLSPALSCLTQLRELSLQCPGAQSCSQPVKQLMQTVSNLTGLTSLVLSRMIETMPTDLATLTQLECFSLTCFSNVSA